MKRLAKGVADRTRVIGYIRVSTEMQADKGSSLEAQQERLRTYCALHEIELVRIEVDAGLSASSLERPGLKRALEALDAFEATGVLVTKLDRLTRSVRDLCDLVETYFKDGQNSLMSVSENIDTRSASGRLVLNILATVSQWEREAAAERTATIMQHMKSLGRFTGGFPPCGWRVDEEGALVEDADEQAILRQARAFREQGMSLRSVAASLPVNPRTGKPFDHKQIARML